MNKKKERTEEEWRREMRRNKRKDEIKEKRGRVTEEVRVKTITNKKRNNKENPMKEREVTASSAHVMMT